MVLYNEFISQNECFSRHVLRKQEKLKHYELFELSAEYQIMSLFASEMSASALE